MQFRDFSKNGAKTIDKVKETELLFLTLHGEQ